MNCPPFEQLQKLASAALGSDRDPAVEVHVEHCAACRHMLDTMIGTVKAAPEGGPQQTIGRTSSESATPAVARIQIPGYEIIKELGRGGMGVVYLARHQGLNRLAAIKMMIRSIQADEDDGMRFRTEAEAIARLQHPNIVQIYEVGAVEGRPFLSLEYVAGGSLADALKGSPQAPADAAAIVALLAEAMHYCHGRGILHRDLKPSNILLAAQEQTTAEGNRSAASGSPPVPISLARFVPKITDFGLAKRLGSQGPTLTGAILGTPSYMPPEQAVGETSIGPAADVFSLGAIFYEMLTGQPPFRGFSSTLTLWQVVHEEPVPPRRLRSQVPADLEAICLKCLQKEPLRRYADAAKLAEDLRAYLGGAPIKARAARLDERLLAWCRTHPSASVVGGVGSVALIGALVGLWFQSPVAIGALAVVSMCVGAWWYSVRLQRALAQVRRQNLLYQPSVARMYLLLETVQRLLAAPSIDERLRILGETAARLVNAERATIFLIDEARGELWSKVALGEEELDIRVPLGSGIAGSVARTGQLINLSDPYNDPRFNPDVDRRTGFKTRNLLTVPMVDASGRCLGVAQVLNKRERDFDSEDAEILANLAISASLLVMPVVHA